MKFPTEIPRTAKYVLAVAIAAVIAWIYVSSNVAKYEDYLYGFWTACGDDFCDDAGIDSMLLFLGPAEGLCTQTRVGYVVIMNDLCNQGVTLKYTRGWGGPGISKYTINADVEFDDAQIWEDRVKIEVDIITGRMVIRSADTVYARLEKVNDVTNIARSWEGAEVVAPTDSANIE